MRPWYTSLYPNNIKPLKDFLSQASCLCVITWSWLAFLPSHAFECFFKSLYSFGLYTVVLQGLIEKALISISFLRCLHAQDEVSVTCGGSEPLKLAVLKSRPLNEIQELHDTNIH